MEKYIDIAIEMYNKGCTIKQAVGIAKDIKKMEELR